LLGAVLRELREEDLRARVEVHVARSTSGSAAEASRRDRRLAERRARVLESMARSTGFGYRYRIVHFHALGSARPLSGHSADDPAQDRVEVHLIDVPLAKPSRKD
jgi:hypothetical protein